MARDLVSQLLSMGSSDQQIAISSRSGDLTYGDLELRTRDIARTLQSLGSQTGDRIGTVMAKSVDAVTVFLGILRAGCVAVPINPQQPAAMMERIIVASDVQLVLHDVGLSVPNVPGKRRETLGQAGPGSFDELIRNYVPSGREHATLLDEDADALILFTSGTTGDPKGVLHGIKSLLSTATSLAKTWGLTSHDTVLHALPINHAHGLVIATLPVLASGGNLRWIEAFEPRTVLEAMHGSSIFMGVPFYYQQLLDSPAFDPHAFSTLRLCVSGSAPLSDALANRFRTETQHEIAQRYGMTETMITTANPCEAIRFGTVGQALPETDIRIVDTSTRATLEPGEIGEVVVSGPTVFKRYLRSELQTNDLELNTGDLGRLDADGYLTLVGRVRDLIIYCGMNVYPSDVESALLQCAGVHDACVFGIPHNLTGESVMAAVVAKPDQTVAPSELRKKLASLLAPHQIPKRILVVPEIPRNNMGKPMRSELASNAKNLGG
ncbi:malonyl-CoA synthase [Tateyamaria omphalii]|uniref:class I adenylate-forming enzyme family protein n=1 Tax=Tateyamaria omphalii TaxID=299262 RepID=UPI0016728A1A|nr:AMP-binding protein [Tateyamaria omphalii]GGX67392.1 malonyl-CoA synthase [Tateyamaria omphalii]